MGVVAANQAVLVRLSSASGQCGSTRLLRVLSVGLGERGGAEIAAERACADARSRPGERRR
jgi:hypothetical protein